MPEVDGADSPDGVELYDFEDFDKSRSLLFDSAKAALLKQFPKEHNGVRMELDDVDYVDPEHYSLAEQQKALQDDAFLGRRLRGTVRLKDAHTGELLDESHMTLMKVPYITDRGTMIREGNEWGTISQQRLIPGAYSRYQKNGDLETQFNVRPGTGKAFRVSLNPASGQYKFNIGGAEIHLYSLLHDLGVSDKEIQKSWGDDVLAQNSAKYDSRTFEKAYNKIVPEWDRKKNFMRTREEKAQLIREALERSQVAKSVVKRTLPNMFDMNKAAAWREQGEAFAKLASVTKQDLKEIAQYINIAADKNIDTNGSAADMLEDIRNVLRTGTADGMTIDPRDDAAAAIRQLQMKRVLDHIRSKQENQPYNHLPNATAY